MDLQQEWQNMSAEMISKNTEQNNSSVQLDAQSNNLMQALLFKLKWKLRWIRIIDLPILIAALFLRGDLQMVLIAIFISYEIFRAFAIVQFNKIKTGVDYSSNTKQVLEDNLKATKGILKIENIYGYIFLPLSGPIGLLVYKLYAYQSFENIIVKSNFFLQIGLLLLMGIALIYVAKKMNNSLFSEHISNLNAKIEQLKD